MAVLAPPGLTLTVGLHHEHWRVVRFEDKTCTIAGAPSRPEHLETVTIQVFPWFSVTVPALAHRAAGREQEFELLPPDPDLLSLLHAIVDDGPSNYATT